MPQPTTIKPPAGTTGADRRGRLSQPGFAPITLAAAVAAGWLIPLPAWAMDLLFVIGFCLAVAAFLAAASARQVVELTALPALTAAATVLYSALAVVATRSLLRTGTAGSVPEILSVPWQWIPSTWQPIVLVAAALAVSAAVVYVTDRTRRQALDYAGSQALLRRAGIVADRHDGTLSESQAHNQRRALLQEVRFYRNLAGLARVVAGQAVIVLIVLIVVLLAASRPASPGGPTPLEAGLPLGGLALLMFAVEILAARAGSVAVRKSSLAQRAAAGPAHLPAEPLTIVSSETGREETVELLNPDFVTVSRSRAFPEETHETITTFEPEPTDKPPTEPTAETAAPSHAEHLPTGTPPDQAIAQPDAAGITETIDTYPTIQDYYRAVVERIESLPKARPVVLAAFDRAALPVTVAVNVALHLVRRKRRILLVDLDPHRGALAEVFDVDRSRASHPLARTCIRGIDLWTGDRDTVLGASGGPATPNRPTTADSNAPSATTAETPSAGGIPPVDRYDCMLLYAPCLDQVPAPQAPPDTPAQAILFGMAGSQEGNTSQGADIRKWKDRAHALLPISVAAVFAAPSQAVAR